VFPSPLCPHSLKYYFPAFDSCVGVMLWGVRHVTGSRVRYTGLVDLRSFRELGPIAREGRMVTQHYFLCIYCPFLVFFFEGPEGLSGVCVISIRALSGRPTIADRTILASRSLFGQLVSHMVRAGCRKLGRLSETFSDHILL
jgi:hypothetical protein